MLGRWVLLAIYLFFMAGCSSNSTKVVRDGFIPAVNDQFDPAGHIVSNPKILLDSSIPKIQPSSSLSFAPILPIKRSLYSVSAVNVPIADLLFQLATDSNSNLNLHSDVTGRITINAIKQPIEKILKSLCDQVSADFIIDMNVITIKPLMAYWQTYPVSYVNLQKKSTDSIVLNMAVGSDTENSSNSKVEVISNHDFWASLLSNVVSLVNVGTSSPSSIAQNTTKASVQNNPATVGASSTLPINANVVVNKEAGLISVYTTKFRHDYVSKFLKQLLNRSNKQVLIEVTVVEVILSDEYSSGIDWSALNGNLSMSQSVIGSSFATGSSQFNVSYSDAIIPKLQISALQAFGETKVLSSPRIMTVSNQTALLKVVDNEVYFTTNVLREAGTDGAPDVVTIETNLHTIPVGFMMSVTPFILDNNEVSLNIRPTLSRIVKYVQDPNPELTSAGVESFIPVIQEREMSSVLKLRDKQTAIIGGLIQDSSINSRRGVPWFSSIPFVGDLTSFRSNRVLKTELIIFIRPIIVNNPDISHGDLQGMQPFLKTDSLNLRTY